MLPKHKYKAVNVKAEGPMETEIAAGSDEQTSKGITITEWCRLYLFGSAEGSRIWCCGHGIIFVLMSTFFRGVGQVVFMDNPWTGLIMFCGLVYYNYYYALLGLIGGCTNCATAIILLGTDNLRLKSANYLNNGIFVYNGLLIGLMSGTFVNGLNTEVDATENGGILCLKLIPFCIIFSYICTSIHVGLTNMFPTFPVFTFPFNVAGFCYLALSMQMTWMQSPLLPYLVDSKETISAVDNFYDSDNIPYTDVFFKGTFRGPVQVYLCGDEYVGIVFLVAIAICNWEASLLALWGSAVGTLFAVLIGVNIERISLGLHSYNSTLTMMGVGCIFSTLNMNNLVMAFFHSIICVLIEMTMLTIMAPFGLPYLTLPFCLSTMFFSVFAYRKRQEANRKKRETKGQMKRAASIRGAPIKLDIVDSIATDDSNNIKLRKAPSARGAPIKLDVL